MNNASFTNAMSIEVEKKFFLNNIDTQKLLEGAEFLGTKIFTDTYYDNDTYDLTLKDHWLRVRDGRWELKIPLEYSQERVVDQYHELETEQEISNYFGYTNFSSLDEELILQGYKPFASIKTTRSKYKKDGFVIDIDVIDFGYEIVEIEKMVENENEVAQAAEDILNFAKRYNLQVGQVRGKVIEYLQRNNHTHFDALVASGVIQRNESK